DTTHGWWPRLLRARYAQRLGGRRRLRRSHPQRREAGRSAGAGADQIRAGDQPQDCQGARPRGPGNRARASRRGDRVNRRDFITLLGGGAVAWPLAARAQQATGQPLVGLLSPLSAAAWVHILGAFRRGMRDLGYVEGANVAFVLRIGSAFF